MAGFESTTGDMDPEAAAAFATGDDAGGGSSTSLSSSSPWRRLFDGDAPGPSVPEIETSYGLHKHWAVFVRGSVRAATGSGIPPIVEIVIGGVLATIAAVRSSEPIAIERTDEGGDRGDWSDVP